MLSLQFSKKIFFLLLFFLFPEIAFSQTKTKATVSPFIIEERAFPGQNFIREITLTNESDEKLNFSILVDDIKLDERGNLFLLPPKTGRFSLADWVEIAEKEVEILPNESKRIKIFFKIPEKEAVGGRQGAIVFTSKANLLEQQREGVFAAFSHQIGVLVFLSSTQEVKEEARILKFETDKKIYPTPILVKFRIEIENFGNVYIEPFGKIEIKNFLKKKKFEIFFNQERLKILPESKRIFEEVWQEKFGFGKYDVTFYLAFGTPKDKGGSGTKTILAKDYFYVIPLKEISFTIVIIMSFFLFFFFLVKRYKRINQKIKEKNGK